MTTIAVINQKGGVGKTTTTVNLGAGLALHGHRVLLIDLDPQANLTSHLEWEPVELTRSTYDLLRGDVPLEDLIVQSSIPNLHLIPSGGDLAAAEVELSAEFGREFILRKQIARARDAGHEYDFILIDCAPSLGLLAVNALTAADEALVPIQAEFFALAGMARFMEVQSLVQERLNPGLSLIGIVICMWKGQANLSREVRDDVRSTFGDVLFETVIRQNVKLAEAPSQGRTIYEYAPESNGAADYASLTAEFLVRHGYSVPDEMQMPRAEHASGEVDDAETSDAGGGAEPTEAPATQAPETEEGTGAARAIHTDPDVAGRSDVEAPHAGEASRGPEGPAIPRRNGGADADKNVDLPGHRGAGEHRPSPPFEAALDVAGTARASAAPAPESGGSARAPDVNGAAGSAKPTPSADAHGPSTAGPGRPISTGGGAG